MDTKTVRKADRKKNDSFERQCWRRALLIPWAASKTNKWVPEQLEPETLWRQK